MPEIYEVANIEEAVELAHKFKEEGRYNWFRGQVQDWPPLSSLNRFYRTGGNEAEKKVKRRLEMFFRWMSGIKELQYLQGLEYIHDFSAILQHYGIPTHYIDFTTDPGVAGFFAADTKTPPAEGKSCIYCVETEDLMDVWDSLKGLDERKGASIELIEIDVQNLWRLQAQHGVFLYANYNWHIDYPMDRILFPYSDYPPYPTPDQIYPENKSPLEQLLDQYFSLETATYVNEEFQEFFKKLQAEGKPARYIEWNSLPGGFYADAFIDPDSLAPTESWSSKALEAWDSAPTEDFYQTAGPARTLKLRPGAGVEEIRRAVSFGVKQVLRSDPSIRSKTVNWSFTGLPENLSGQELNEWLRPAWNGMRRLPYTHSDIADAFGAIAALFIREYRTRHSVDAQMELFSEVLGESLEVGFNNIDGSDSRGFAVKESLRKALRPDMPALLKPEHYSDNVRDIFRVIYNPKLMFEFEEFKNLFAREVIPAQAASRRQLLLFNPARLITFGLP